MMLRLSGGQEPVPVPAGRFEFMEFEEWLTPDASRPRPSLWVGRAQAAEDVIEVVPGKTLELAIGSPLQVGVAATQRAGVVHFVFHETDASGRRPASTLSEREMSPPPPTIKILDAAGRGVAECKVEWNDGAGVAEWRPAPGVMGTFSATIDYTSHGFPFNAGKTTFEVK
jgi:hypothetical protein